jgi:hypothetical protein
MKLKTRLHPAIFIFALALFSSCKGIYYFPAQQPHYNYKEKNDLHLEANISLSPLFIGAGASAQAGFAISDHLALTAGVTGFGSGSGSSANSANNGIFSSAGVTAFTNTQEGSLQFQVTGGVGVGGIKLGNAGSAGSAGINKTSFNSFFLQPTMLFSNKKNFDFGISVRGSQLNYHHFNLANDEWNDLRANATPFILEPSFSLAFGGGIAKYKLAFSTRFYASGDIEDDLSGFPLILHTGIVANINTGRGKRQ